MTSFHLAPPVNLPTPLNAASAIIPEYPQFQITDAPRGSNASHAWTGLMQPFHDDAAALRFLHCVETGRSFDVIEGVIEAPHLPETQHWADLWLFNMEMRFRLLILEFEGTEHPRAYSLQPEISHQMHFLHPHLRADKSILVKGRPLPALCIYSGAEFTYSSTCPRIVQFLDQVAVYIGRHIIWLKTRIKLPNWQGDSFRTALPEETLLDLPSLVRTDPNFSVYRSPVSFWTGYWPGPAAPSGTVDHLKTISRSQECWCWSGKKYEECHRPIELQRLSIGGHQ